jgi:diphosphomevalonate decarboxylase
MMFNSLEDKFISQARELLNPAVFLPGQAAWECPSNIALVKYWGKTQFQQPLNPSVSMTLQHSKTVISVDFFYQRKLKEMSLSYFFEDKQHPTFEDRYRQYLEHVSKYLPFLNHTELVIKSRNTFPHSAGIASSASSFGALALALCDIERSLFGTLPDDADFMEKASFLARLGSGSACRSVYGGFSLWGRTEDLMASTDEAAISLNFIIHPVFTDYCDSILVVDSGKKEVSSSAGHRLMEHHPFSGARIAQVQDNLKRMLISLQTGKEQRFSTLVEEEALTLHAMMLTSRPGYILLKPNSLEVIDRIRQFRNSTGMPVSFTLDAGANVHLLYPARLISEIKPFVMDQLAVFCQEGNIIHDTIGTGPVKLL